MEVGGLAVGVVALAGLFNNALDSFEYIQLGQNFGTNFQTSLLQLDIARLQLSRWGQAVGLNGDLEELQSLQKAKVQEEDISKAESVLGQIMELFARAEKISAKYKHFVETDNPTLAVLDVQTDMDDIGRSLHEKIRKLCIERQKNTSLRRKVKWALYEEKHFKSLIENINNLVGALPEMFPAVKQQQLKLCEIEVSAIDTDNLSILARIIQSQDKDLEAAISAAARSDKESKQGAVFNNNNGSKIMNQVANMTNHGGQTFHF